MRLGEVSDLMAAWKYNPPAHIAATHLRNVVISALGGTPPDPDRDARATTAEELAAAFGLSVPGKVAPRG